MDKYIGRLLDNRYEILDVLGTGGMAVVYKARCHRLNRLVAIKILKDDYMEDEEFRRRFHSESQAVAMLSHPNIVSVYDVSTSITADYIVMELIDGITLKQYMEKKGVLNWKETLHFAIQIAKALEHAHSRGIVHRDIKPHNVMVLKNGSVKVTDFGIARMMSKGNTLTKEALGSVHYISPEQAKGGRVDNRSDIYSLGVVMYEMMSGRPPYDGESPVAVAIQHINGGAIMPSTLNPNIPGGLEQIIMKAMGHEPEQRYETAGAMLADLDEFRKHPDILFDYNAPPLDDVTRITKPPLILDPTPSTAERVAERAVQEQKPRTPERRRAPGGTPTRATSRPRQNRVEEKRSNVATIAIVACSLVMVAAILIFFAVFFLDRPQEVTVPDLVGKNYKELPVYENFRINHSSFVFDDEVPADIIIKQTPEAGKEITKNETIYVVVSLGKAPETEMPDLKNWEVSLAQQTLENKKLNLDVQIRYETSDTVGEGRVIRTIPEAKAELKNREIVILYVSEGKQVKTSKMPPLAGKKRDKAVEILNDQKLDLDITFKEEFDSVVPEGCVIRSTPGEGEDLTTGASVTLYISKGPEMKELVDVTSLFVDQATTTLLNAGFSNFEIQFVESDDERGTVIAMYAKVGDEKVPPKTTIDVKSRIVLEVSKKPTQKPQVTKDVTIDLKGSTLDKESHVTIKKDGEVVFDQLVPMGTETISLGGQTGSGDVFYEVIIGEDGWIQTETF